MTSSVAVIIPFGEWEKTLAFRRRLEFDHRYEEAHHLLYHLPSREGKSFETPSPLEGEGRGEG
jgi:hypothetical protein